MTLFEQVVEHFGGTQTALAEALGVTHSAVSQWNGVIPKNRAYEIEVLSEGRFTAVQIKAEHHNAGADRAA